MLKADESKIKWLIFESGVSMYSVSKNTGIPQSTLSDLKKEKTDIEKMLFKNAAKLTEYAEKLLQEN